jgi:multidrug efflux pump subunit AcrA (membrane-fusion protein)
MNRIRRIGKIVWRIVAGLLVVVFLVGMMLWLSGAFRDKTEPGPLIPKVKAKGVTTEPVQRRTFPLLIEQVGSIRNQVEAKVASRIMAQVIEIAVQEGDSVRGAQTGLSATLLARLDDRDLQAREQQVLAQIQALERGRNSAQANLESTQAQFEAARARLEQAVSDFRRYEKLYQSGAATGQQYEQAKTHAEVAEAQVRSAQKGVEAAHQEIERIAAQIEEAKSSLQQMQVQLSYTEIRAPFAGRVTRKLAEAGDTVGPGQTLFILETEAQPELHAVVSESLLPYLNVGNQFSVQIDALQKTCEGKVREVIPRSDPATRTVLVKITLPETPKLVSGMFGRLFIPTGTYEAVVIPQPALQKVGQMDLVQIVDAQGYLQRRFVTLGKSHDTLQEILSGLQEGEQVVIP